MVTNQGTKNLSSNILRSILVEESKVAAKEENQAKTLLRVELEIFQLYETEEKTKHKNEDKHRVGI